MYQECTVGCGNVRCVAIADDLNLVGQAPAVFKAFDRFEKKLQGTGLILQKAKCALLWPRPTLPESVRAEANKRGLVCRVGTMEALGGLVGCGDDAFNLWLQGYIDGLQPYFDMLLHPELPVQVMMLLRLSAIPKIGYLTRVTPPRLLEAHAKRFDNMVLNTSPEVCTPKSSLQRGKVHYLIARSPGWFRSALGCNDIHSCLLLFCSIGSFGHY